MLKIFFFYFRKNIFISVTMATSTFHLDLLNNDIPYSVQTITPTMSPLLPFRKVSSSHVQSTSVRSKYWTAALQQEMLTCVQSCRTAFPQMIIQKGVGCSQSQRQFILWKPAMLLPVPYHAEDSITVLLLSTLHSNLSFSFSFFFPF